MKRLPLNIIFSVLKSASFKISATYLIVAALWILLSDKILWMLVKDQDVLVGLSIFKGWFFVASTALMLYALIRKDISRIKQSELEARLSEAKYREVVETANIIIIRQDLHGRITLFNRFAQELFGYSLQEVLGRNVIGTIVPEVDLADRVPADKTPEAGDNKQPYDRAITENMKKNGDRIWIAWSTKPILDQNGRVREFLSIGNDITAHRLAQEAVRESEQKFQDILNRAPSAVYIKDREGRYTFVNTHFERLSGLSGEQVLNQTDFDLFPADVARQSVINDQKAYKMFAPLETEEIAPVGGEMHTFISAKFPLYDVRGEAYAICGISTDIDLRKQAERKSEDMLHFMQTLLDTIPSPIFYEDDQGRFLGCNDAFEQYLGLSKAQIVGKGLSQIAPDDLAHKSLFRDSILLQVPGKQIYESQLVYADGQKHDMICSVATFLNAEAKVAGLVGVMTDITERKSAEMEREKLIEELQSALSKVRLLSGFLPICSSCKKIRDDQGYWQQLEAYIRDHSEAEFSHSICPDCAEKLYPGLTRSRQ